MDDHDLSQLTYREVGGTREAMPRGYQHLERQRVLGRGVDVFERASDQLMAWGVQRGAGLVVETDAATLLDLAVGRLSWADAEAAGRLCASGERSDLSGFLPLVPATDA